jgi:hypothetical protein
MTDKLSSQDYQKAIGQLRLQLNGVMNCFRCYGMKEDVDAAIPEIIKLSEQFARRVSGEDIPILVRDSPKHRPTD